MPKFKYKNLSLWLCFAAFLSFITFYHYMTLLPQEQKTEKATTLPTGPVVVTPDSRIYLQERYVLCDKYGLGCGSMTLLEGAARSDLNNLTEQELIQKYPPKAGWKVTWEGKQVILQQLVPGICPEHSERWHLGADEHGYVGVYLGPSVMGKEGGEVKKTAVPLKKLPDDIQERIVKGSMEFLDWNDVIATLDSLNEYAGVATT